jgi:hypothetical protein
MPTETELRAARSVLRAIQGRRIVRREDEFVVRLWAKITDRNRPLDKIACDILQQAGEGFQSFRI